MTPADILPMTPLQSQALLWTLIGGAVMLVHGLATMGSRRSRAEDQLADAIMTARHPKQTMLRATCPDCRHTQERAVPFRPDLGAVCESFKRCLACKLDQNQPIEISLDMSAAEIGHALSDLLEPGVPAPMPAASQCLRDGAAHSERADRQQHS